MQGDLFSGVPLGSTPTPNLPITANQLRGWQQRLHDFQSPRFRRNICSSGQGDLWGENVADSATPIDPLTLTPLPLSFWRWADSPHRGAAIYFVLDRPPHLDHPLLLYLGETKAADRRWKGEHDCKAYLAAYGESLQRCQMAHQLSIRFCCDVPTDTRARRRLEQQLIQHWSPPFNKETRQRWATPFTADL
jgi:hypothetical protein